QLGQCTANRWKNGLRVDAIGDANVSRNSLSHTPHDRVGRLLEGFVILRLNIVRLVGLQPELLHVSHHSDNLVDSWTPRRLLHKMQMLADRVLPRKISVGKALIDHGEDRKS